jgi:hypothetical protein
LPVEQLVWFVTAGARVWVPTWAELGELTRQRGRERAHSSSTKQPQQRQQKPLDKTHGNATSELLNQEMEPHVRSYLAVVVRLALNPRV